MDRGTGRAVTDAEGHAVTATTTFVPALSSGSATVTFELDASTLAGHPVVAFESLSLGGHVVATHEDINDDWQTVSFPRVGTTAADAADGDHEVGASASAGIVDTVEYSGLVPGLEYVVTGTLADRETGEPVIGADGTKVEASATFTPNAT